MYLRQGRLRALVCVVALLCLPPVQASAITPNDIRGWYGVALQQDVRPLLAEARQVAQSIRTAESIDEYNAVLEQYPVAEVRAQLEEYSTELMMLSTRLRTEVDLSLEDILSLEQQYYTTRNKADALSQTLDTVSSLHPFAQDEDVDALRESFDSLQRAIETAGYYEDIGRLGVWPAQGVKYNYNSNFGSRWDPVTNSGYSYHSGVDLYAPMNTPVLAAFSGTVYRTGYSYTSGNYIYLDHGHGVRSFYCHLSVVQVREGQNMPQGSQIALSGNTGSRTTGPHLHFGIYIDGTAVDPKVVLEHD